MFLGTFVPVGTTSKVLLPTVARRCDPKTFDDIVPNDSEEPAYLDFSLIERDMGRKVLKKNLCRHMPHAWQWQRHPVRFSTQFSRIFGNQRAFKHLLHCPRGANAAGADAASAASAAAGTVSH